MRPALALVIFATCGQLLGAADPPWLIARLGNDRFRQRERVSALTYSPDGKFLASADGHTIHIWDTADGRRIRSIPIERDEFFALRYSADGRTLFAAGCDDRSTRLVRIDPTTGKVRSNVALRAGKSEGILSEDGRWLALRPELDFLPPAPRPKPLWQIHVVNLETGNDWTDQHHEEISACAFSPNRTALAVATADGTLRIYDSRSGKILHRYSMGVVRSLVYSSDGIDLVAFRDDSKQSRHIARFAASDGTIRWKYEANVANEINLINGGKALVYLGKLASEGDAHQWKWHWLNAETGRSTGITMDSDEGVRSRSIDRRFHAVAWNEIRQALATSEWHGLIAQWDLSIRKCTPLSADPAGPVYDPHITSDGKRARAWNAWGWFEWDVETGRQSRVNLTARTSPLEGREFSRDWKWRMQNDSDVTEFASGKKHLTLFESDQTGDYHFLSNDRLVVECRHGLSVYDLVTRKRRAEILLGDRLGRIHVASNGNCVAKIGLDQALNMVITRWDLDSGKVISEWKGEVPGFNDMFREVDIGSGIHLSPNGRIATFTSSRMPAPHVVEERTVAIDVATGRKLGDWIGSRSDGVTFTPDSRSVFIYDRQPFSCSLYELASGEFRGQFTFPGTTVGDFSFSPEGRRLIVATRPYPVEIWDLVGDQGPWESKKPDAVWQALALPKGNEAYAAIRHLLGHPNEAVALLKVRVKVPEALDSKWLKERLTALDAPQFRDRERATSELADAGELAISAMHEALTSASPEARQRLKILIDKAQGTTSEKLIAIRACEVLEGLGTREAAKLLEDWSKGVPGTTLVRESQESIERIKARR